MRKLVLFLMICFVIVSCSSKPPKKTENPVDLYVAGVDSMKKKKYDESIKKFSAIREQYPFDPMALVASVKLGDTYFLKKDYVLAAGTYEDYFKAHPDEENIPYVLFKLGECYEKLSPTVDRDQANTLKGIERITYLRNRYPNTPYAAESADRLKAFIQKLADRELYVGEFYVRTAQYNGAIIRLEGMLKRFPESKNTDKALFYLCDAHRQLGDQQKANEYLETLRTKYPKSMYARATVRERKTLKVTQAPPTAGETTKQAPAPAGSPGLYQGTRDTIPVPSSVESPTIDSPQAVSSAPAALQVAAPAQASPYVERPRKVIDLRPPETQAAGQTAAITPAEAKAPSSGNPVEPAKTARPQKLSEQVKDAGPADTGGPQKPVEMARSTAAAKPKTETGKSSDKVLGMIDQKKPIDIVSDTMEGFEKEKYVIFKGNVVAKQDDLYIYSDSMEAYMSTDTNEIDKANAKGHVRIIKQNRTATCQEAYFDNVKGEILLKGNAVVTSDKDRVEGDEVTYYVNEDRAVVTAEKTKKAKITIYPKQGK